ncbi:hypothetical protein GCM10018980_26460 [Streptomyces capoamus]|uniref:Uncharacterized protein n=1 Tax=Streptomyces capoamus TaxID=68183 RepID=A0A919EVG2_9ACTN|nr:hypothetical protein GCM10010501_61230 [Streptomyces libani subsp. rufus]GHG47052.1 hypothetical protein GCM10018980_26460 [Streptomyces capoamus]
MPGRLAGLPTAPDGRNPGVRGHAGGNRTVGTAAPHPPGPAPPFTDVRPGGRSSARGPGRASRGSAFEVAESPFDGRSPREAARPGCPVTAGADSAVHRPPTTAPALAGGGGEGSSVRP